MYDPSQPPLISETLLKKRRSLEELAFKRSITVQTQQKRKRVVRGEDVKIKRPEQFVMEFRVVSLIRSLLLNRDSINMKRMSFQYVKREGSQNKLNRKKRQDAMRKNGSVKKSQIRDTVGFAVRIHEGRHSSPEIKAALSKMGLRKKYDGIFYKLDEAGIGQLKPLEAYIAFGYISNKSVDELLHRKACIRKAGKTDPLTDNVTVEKLLGEKGILCINDLAHEIYTVASNFESAVGILAPFHLSTPIGHFEKKILKEHEEIESKAGFLGETMDAFLAKLL